MLSSCFCVQVRVIDEAETTLSSIDNASDRLVQSVLKQAHQSGNYSSGDSNCLLCALHLHTCMHGSNCCCKCTARDFCLGAHDFCLHHIFGHVSVCAAKTQLPKAAMLPCCYYTVTALHHSVPAPLLAAILHTRTSTATVSQQHQSNTPCPTSPS